MGGYGSGQRLSKKNTVEDCRLLDANRWMREGILRQGVWQSGKWAWWNPRTLEKTSSIDYELNTIDPSRPWLRLNYTITRTQEKFDYKVALQTTCPNYGGIRWWFTCPLIIDGRPCSRRVVKLYLPLGGQYYGCRVCYNLTYRSCQESHRYDSLFATIARNIPGATPRDVKEALSV